VSTTPIQKGTSLWKDGWHRLSRNRAAVAGMVLLLLIVATCIILPLTGMLPSPIETNLADQYLPPSAKHPMGTDQVGRDMFSRMIYGGQISIAVGLITTLATVIVGVVWGAVAGYAGGRLDRLMMRIVDFLFALPFLIIIILLRVILDKEVSAWTDGVTKLLLGSDKGIEHYNVVYAKVGPIMSLMPVFLAIAALSWLTISRIVRAQVQSVKSLDYVEAARSLGLGHMKILFRHILPNTLGPVIVYTTLTIPGVMLFEATLSFLGLGVRPPYSSWGVLIFEGANVMMTSPAQLAYPAALFTITLLSLNFLGDGLRDAFDPRSSKD
jgi:oligopeptide transport system permease protein